MDHLGAGDLRLGHRQHLRLPELGQQARKRDERDAELVKRSAPRKQVRLDDEHSYEGHLGLVGQLQHQRVQPLERHAV